VIWRAALVGAFAALLVLPPLGQRLIVTGDEARFAVLAQDMLTRSTLFDARVRDQRYRNKPLLYPWMIKLLSIPSGRVTETTAQLPIALSAVGAVVFTTLLGQQLFSARAGVLAGLITATSYGFFAHSQILLPDMLVVAFGLAALCAFWAAVGDPPNSRALVAFYAAVALGVAAKGPMGVLPVLVVAVWLVTGRGLRGLRSLASTTGLLAFLVVTGVWLLPYLLAGSRSFARSVVWGDWLGWYLGGPQPLEMLNMLLDGAKGLIPWTPLLVLPLLAVRRQWHDVPFRFAFLAWIVPLVAVMLSQNHRARYLLPTYPAAGLLLAWWCDRRDAEPSRAVPIVAGLTAAGGLAALVVIAVPWVDPVERRLVEHFWSKAALIAAGGLVLTGWACWALLTGRRTALVAGVAVVMAGLLTGGVQVHNQWVNRSQDYPALAALVERYSHGGAVGITGGRFFSLDFYLGRAVTPVRTVAEFDAWLGRPDRPIVVIIGREWSRFRNEARSDVEVLDTMRIRAHLMFLVRLAEPDAPRPDRRRSALAPPGPPR
jgi:4-amino-4-deoxy-L-arabinose transferase-like glycosyltransferase